MRPDWHEPPKADQHCCSGASRIRPSGSLAANLVAISLLPGFAGLSAEDAQRHGINPTQMRK
jgi:hypothetical protein